MIAESSSDILAVMLIICDSIKRSDAIILLEGDYYNRLPTAVSLLKKGFAPYIVASGGVDEPKHPGSFHARQMAQKLFEMGVPQKSVILEDRSKHTRDQAVEIMKLVKEHKWQKIILVASHYHQLRAFLTFLKAMKETGLEIAMYNAPARNLPWFKADPVVPRFELLQGELDRIEAYTEHVERFKEVASYMMWRDKNFE